VAGGSYKKLLEQINSQLAPFSAFEKGVGASGAVARLVEDMNRQNDVLRAAYGPIEELRRSGVLTTLTESNQAFRSLQQQIEAATQRFSLPEVTTATELLQEFYRSDAAQIAEQFRAKNDYLAQAVEAMRSPWVDVAAQMRSVGAFAELQSIGLALRTVPSFNDQLTEMLRGELGDWRERMAWPEDIFDNPIARTNFYAERGLDTSLTAFPADAFEQSLGIAGLSSAPPALIDVYDFEEVPEADEQEAAFARTNAAHDRLQRFETQVRLFIDQQMTRNFGEHWPKHRIPSQMRQSWIDRREKARSNGESDHPLIACADFADSAPIITQKNNWNDVFAPFFQRQASVQESFQRLYPIRICTMHARMITQDDELYLLVETKRVLVAIGVGV